MYNIFVTYEMLDVTVNSDLKLQRKINGLKTFATEFWDT